MARRGCDWALNTVSFPHPCLGPNVELEGLMVRAGLSFGAFGIIILLGAAAWVWSSMLARNLCAYLGRKFPSQLIDARMYEGIPGTPKSM